MKRWIAIAMVLTLPGQSFASTFKILGLRPMGMGGANVAIAEGPTAQYWNPGALALTSGSGFQIPLSFQFEATGDIMQKADAIVADANHISSLQDAQKKGDSISLTQVKDFNDAVVRLTDLNKGGSGVLAGVTGGVDIRVKRMAVSLNNFTEAGISPFVDTNFSLGSLSGLGGVKVSGDPGLTNPSDPVDTASRNQVADVITNMQTKYGLILNGATAQEAANRLVNDAHKAGLTTTQISDIASQAQTLNTQLANSGLISGSGALVNNTSNVTIRGASLSELAFGYGHPMPLPDRFGQLGVGGNIKMIRGDVAYAQVSVVNGQSASSSELSSDFSRNQKTTYKPAVDVGVLWRAPFQHTLQVGLLARNLNSPSFSQPADGVANGEPDLKASMQSRGGVAFWPFKRLVLSSDLDLTKNATAVPGFSSRVWGAGAELRVLFLSLRAGLLKNIAQGTPLSYTAGLGISVWALKIDLGGAISSRTVLVDDRGTRVPTSFQAGLTVGLVFGASKHKKRHS